MNLKHSLIKFLTALLPLKPLRWLYRQYAALTAWVKYGDATFPRIISIEINTHCNRACTYCPNVVQPQAAKLMDWDVFTRIVDRLRTIRYSGVVDFIFFSEPTLHPRLAVHVAYVKQQVPWCVARICTNGDLLNTRNVAALEEAGLDRIYAMRHNPTPDGWRERMAALERAHKGIFVMMDIDRVEAEQGLHDFEGLVKVKKHRGRQEKKGRAYCDVHTHVAQIGYNGDWLLCCVDYARTLTFGNLIQDDIMTIWRKPSFARLRGELRSGVARLPKCIECACFKDPVALHKERPPVGDNLQPATSTI